MATAGAETKVPVTEVAGIAYRLVFGQLNLLLDLAWLPLLVLLAITILPGYFELYRGMPGLPAWYGDAFGLSFENLIEAVVGLLCLSAFAVRWYQVLLLGGRPAPGKTATPPPGIFAGAWLRFLGYIVLLYVVAAALLTMAILAGTDTAPSFVAPIAGVVVTAIWLGTVRCSLVFPAAAIAAPISLVAAWRNMRGNSWRLLATMLLASVPTVFVVAMIIGGVLAALHIDSLNTDVTPPLGFFLLRGVVSCCANFLVVALNAAALAAFYRRLVRARPSPQPERLSDTETGSSEP